MSDSNESIDLWAERGVPHPEILRRIRERPLRECALAQQWMASAAMSDDALRKLIDMADALRSTVRICALLEPRFRQSYPPEMPLPLEYFLELNALMVEMYVRAADDCFSRPSLN